MPPPRPPLRCEPLEGRTTPAALVPTTPVPATAFVVGAAPGQDPYVTVYDATGGVFARLPAMSFDPTGASGAVPFRGGVTATLGDVTGDGTPDIVAGAGAGGGPRVQVFDGKTYALVRDFFAFDPSFAGGVYLAAKHLTGDAADDIITGAGAGGGPHVKAFDGTTGAVALSFFAYDPAFAGGVSVASSPRVGLGKIVTGAGPGGGPHVKVFDWETETRPGLFGSLITERTGRYIEVASYFAFDPSFRGGVNVAFGLTGGEPIPLPPTPVPAAHGVTPAAVAPAAAATATGYSRILVVASPATGGTPVVGVDPEGRQVFAVDPFGPPAVAGAGRAIALRDVTGDRVDDLVLRGGPRVRVLDGRGLAAGGNPYAAPLFDLFLGDPAGLGGGAVG
jgi:hypothetical protein